MTQSIVIPTTDEIRSIFREELALAKAAELPQEAAELEKLKRKAQLKPSEVAKLYGYSVGTLANWRSAGKGPEYIQEGDGPVYYPQAAIKAYCDACRKKTYA